MDAATNRERPGDAAVSGRRDAMGRTDLLLSGRWQSDQAEGTEPKQQQQTTTAEHHFLLPYSLPKTGGRGRGHLTVWWAALDRAPGHHTVVMPRSMHNGALRI